jgi:hypothetical protein
MENYSDSDTSSESEFDSIIAESDNDESQDDESQDLEPEPSEYYDEYRNVPWNPDAQIQAQLDSIQLAQLHAEIKARAEIPVNPTYPKLARSWPFRLFNIRSLPEYVVHPIHYFELFWSLDVWNTLVDNTNTYAQYRQARGAHGNADQKARWWKAVTLYEMRIFIALLIYIGIVGTSNIASFWGKCGLTIHKPMEFMTYYRYQQIMRYFHISPLIPTTPWTQTTTQTQTTIRTQTTTPWYIKLEPLASLLRTKFQAYVILGQNVSFDEMMVPFSGRSRHTLKMKNKPISEGFKVWALCDHGYL